MRVWAFMLALAAAPNVAEAADAFFTGNQLYAQCTQPRESSVFYSVCLGFVIGVADTMQAYINAEQFCFAKEGLTTGQIKDVVVQFLASHPAERHKPAASLVYVALSEAFPCRR